MSAKAELLRLLRQSDTFISGEELSRQLGITRAAVWKNMELLREEGYTIESVTRKGYRNIPLRKSLRNILYQILIVLFSGQVFQ